MADRLRTVLDSFALLALIRREPAGPAVADLLVKARDAGSSVALCSISLGEVVYQVRRKEGGEGVDRFLSDLYSGPISIHDADRDLVLEAAELKAVHPMSFADCFAAALAMRLDATVVTGDPEFRHVEHLVPVMWLPRAN